MAFGIRVYEKDEYLYALIKERLQTKFPEAYIYRYDKGDFTLTSNIKVLFDNKQFDSISLKENSTKLLVPLYENNTIDIKRIAKAILNDTSNDDSPGLDPIDNQVRLLISYAYIDERENFISQVLGPSSFSSMHPIRIDLMSGIRMPRSIATIKPNNALSTLLRICTNKNFKPDQIIDYLGPDTYGFLSPGKPINNDDVFDIGIDASAALMTHTKSLCQKISAGALFVAEGWRINESLKLIANCDSLHILLPARMCTEDTGMTSELGIFQRNLKLGASMTVYYYEDYKGSNSENHYEPIKL
ncbi:MAG: hypothetical protein MJ094_07580 [Saccharofermentans sp.]|nr:hypothetical protein [Saccharofermentans sp.]